MVVDQHIGKQRKRIDGDGQPRGSRTTEEESTTGEHAHWRHDSVRIELATQNGQERRWRLASTV